MAYIFDEKSFDLRFGKKIHTDDGFDRWYTWHCDTFKNEEPPKEYIDYLNNCHEIELTDEEKTRPGSKAAIPLTKEQIDYIIKDFEKRGDLRMCCLCCFMIQVLRISDVLNSITKGSVYYQNGEVRHEVKLYEQKTGKKRILPIYDPKSEEHKRDRFYFFLKKYYKELKGLPNYAPLFYNQRGTPLSDRGVRKLLSHYVGVENIEQCSCHSFRKGAATWLALHGGVSVAMLQDLMNHSDIRTTMMYVGILSEEKAATAAKLIW